LGPAVLTRDVETVGERASATEYPARAAVHGNVLIASGTAEVDAIYVAPVPGLGDRSFESGVLPASWVGPAKWDVDRDVVGW
jgi:hypothetical protein